jgi:hypothetical protein
MQMTRLSAAVLWALLAGGCSNGSDSSPDAQAERCEAPNTWHYETSGCDGQAKRTCGPAFGDACFSKVLCGCDGQDIVICEFSTRQWRSEGPCPGSDFDARGQ